MNKVLIQSCTIEKPHSKWYEVRLNESFAVVKEDGEYLVVYDSKYDFNRRVLKNDAKVIL